MHWMLRWGRSMVCSTQVNFRGYPNVGAVAISLIPYTYHALVIKSAIRKRVNVVTTSYISPSMQELEGDIDKAGITVMNEIGLDPVCVL